MALTLPCLSRAACAEPLLSASPRFLSGALRRPFGTSTPKLRGAHFSPFGTSTPKLRGAHFSPFCGRPSGGFGSSLESATPRSLQDMASRTRVSVPRHLLRSNSRELTTGGEAYFMSAPEEPCAAGLPRGFFTATPTSLEEMSRASSFIRKSIMEDSFCLNGAFESDRVESGEATSLHSIAESSASFCVPGASEDLDLTVDQTSSIAGLDRHFFDTATPRCLADMVSDATAESTHRFLANRVVPMAPVTTHFVPFSIDLCGSPGSATPISLADMVKGGSCQDFCDANPGTADAHFAAFRSADHRRGNHRESASIAPSDTAMHDSTVRFCSSLESRPAMAQFLPFREVFGETGSATPKSMADW